MPQTHMPITVQPSPAYTSAAGSWLPAEYPNRVKWAWDNVGRIAYLPLVFRRIDRAGTVLESAVHMVTVNRATGAVALKARAPIQAGTRPDPYAVMSVWDSINQRVVFPVMTDPCGRIRQMLVYNSATNTWEDTPVPPNTHGATVGHDPSGTLWSWRAGSSARARPRIRRGCTSGATGPRPARDDRPACLPLRPPWRSGCSTEQA